jgi:hypothetical protein
MLQHSRARRGAFSRLLTSKTAVERRIIECTRRLPRAHDNPLESNLHSPERRLIELRMEHADLDALIDRASDQNPLDELTMRRLKKRRLALRDEISRLELILDPKEPA